MVKGPTGLTGPAGDKEKVATAGTKRSRYYDRANEHEQMCGLISGLYCFLGAAQGSVAVLL